MYEIGLDDLKFKQSLLVQDLTMQTTSYSHPLICFSCRFILTFSLDFYYIIFCFLKLMYIERTMEQYVVAETSVQMGRINIR